MEHSNYLPDVKAQYEDYPYPAVNPEEEKHRLYMPVTECLDRLNHHCFGGKRNVSKGFRALVAGGGTGDGVVLLAEQLRHTDAEIVYLDMSKASRAIAEKRAALRGLTNITWITDSILEIPKLGLGKFDYINCSGVLHHLQNPDAGLRILADALKDDGAMGLMVYATYGRAAVYQMQALFRLINKEEADHQAQVNNARAVLDKIPGSHWLVSSPEIIQNEVSNQGDIGLYDLFLHSQDRSYTVPELYTFVEGAGLTLQHFHSSEEGMGINLYNPDLYIHDDAIRQKIRHFPERERQAIAELMHSKMCRHVFYVVKTPQPRPSVEELDNVPFLGIQLTQEHFYDTVLEFIRKSEGVVAMVVRPTDRRIVFAKTDNVEALFKAIDGKRTLKEIFRKVMDAHYSGKNKPSFQGLAMEFNVLFDGLHMHDLMFMRHVSVPAFRTVDDMQNPVSAKYAGEAPT